MAGKTQGGALAGEAEIMRRLGHQLAELGRTGLAGLRSLHVELFGEDARSKNLPFLRRRLAFRLQERVEGGLSPEARTRIEVLAPETLPTKTTKPRTRPSARPRKQENRGRDPRLPEAGTVLNREHKGFAHEVEVLESGFRYRGRVYTSLSTIAREITGTSWNGFAFFGLSKEKRHDEA